MKPKSIERKMRKHKIGKPKYDETNLVTTSRQQSTTINRKHVMKTKLLNIQGLTKAKAIEIEQLLDKNVILCLTETQQKISSVREYNKKHLLEVMMTKRWRSHDIIS